MTQTTKTIFNFYLRQIFRFTRQCQSVLPFMWCFVKHCFNFILLLHGKFFKEDVTYKPCRKESKLSIKFIIHIPNPLKCEHENLQEHPQQDILNFSEWEKKVCSLNFQNKSDLHTPGHFKIKGLNHVAPVIKFNIRVVSLKPEIASFKTNFWERLSAEWKTREYICLMDTKHRR